MNPPMLNYNELVVKTWAVPKQTRSMKKRPGGSEHVCMYSRIDAVSDPHTSELWLDAHGTLSFSNLVGSYMSR